MLTVPTLLLDTNKCKDNIQRMAAKSKKHQVDFRPHFKTHQSLEIGKWFKDASVNKITVSSVAMAEYFSADWDDITIAFPTNILEIDRINALAEKITLNIQIESVETMLFLADHLRFSLNFFIKIDVGYHRTGMSPDDTDPINQILHIIENNPLITFKGFLGHAGHTYQCRTKECIKKIQRESLDILQTMKEKFKERYPSIILSIGDTPGCSVAEDFSGADEIRPGNFVFYDLTQNQIGSNEINQIAVAMACPVVAIHKERNEIIIYGGGVHFAKDRLEDVEGTIFGRVVEKRENGWGEIIADMYIKSLSQEHGTVAVPQTLMEHFKIGDILYILPVHSCMTANSMRSYLTLEGKKIGRLG
jgi:D-serine deaminase-like pyridoxal phosphate-dependent protein